jgi:hypothetical protein
MKKPIILRPVEMTKAVMQDLEKRNLIIRISPDTTNLKALPGQTLVNPIYSSSNASGPHKLMFITLNRRELTEFGTHPDNEDFLLIGDTDTKPLYLVIALCHKDELDKKIKSKTVSSDDFITLRVKHNDADVSFFTMLKDIPHGEAVGKGSGKPASFYVGESRDLIDVDTDMGDFELIIEE